MSKQEEFKVPDNFPKPFGQRVIVKEIQQEETKTAGGIIMPGTKQLQDCGIGILVAKGGQTNAELVIGDYVAFDKRSNLAVYHQGIPYLHMQEFELWMSFDKNDTRFAVHVADTEELRREKRQEFTKNNKAISDEAIDKLDNESDMGKKKTTIIMPNKGVN